uniref:Uncharacterized protein n=1 Tax=Eutreptiella gymnastica TaxID=73025 RepID=A0A7S1JFB1_9EUGL|mmetsp:Transcript_91322/g.158317  ORF Transcript_91322/g.158317 Transcript_91322/m.158317 type:complete len:127 (+) Transcript_91322:22-402(+)
MVCTQCATTPIPSPVPSLQHVQCPAVPSTYLYQVLLLTPANPKNPSFWFLLPNGVLLPVSIADTQHWSTPAHCRALAGPTMLRNALTSYSCQCMHAWNGQTVPPRHSAVPALSVGSLSCDSGWRPC